MLVRQGVRVKNPRSGEQSSCNFQHVFAQPLGYDPVRHSVVAMAAARAQIIEKRSVDTVVVVAQQAEATIERTDRLIEIRGSFSFGSIGGSREALMHGAP